MLGGMSSLAEFDVREWDFLPPLADAELPEAPPPKRDPATGVVLGSELASVSLGDRAQPAADLARAVCGELFATLPGLAEIARLGAADFAALDAAQRVDALLAFERQQSWLEARRQELLALVSTSDSSDKHWCIEEIGAALRLSGGVARAKLAGAEQLVNRLPETLRALSAGEITVAQATVIVEASFELDDAQLPSYQDRVLARAGEQSLTELKRAVKRAVHLLDPATAEDRTRRAIANRTVRIAPAGYGTAWLMALLPAADAQAIYTRLDAAARMAPAEDARTMDQLRADALVDGVLCGIAGELPPEQGRQPVVQVIVGLDTLVGKNDEPGWLDGYGPISAGYARQLAHDPTGTWRRLITDPRSGQLLDYGTTRYRPPQHLADHVIARDGECTFPFCNQSARRADLDHLKPFPAGRTSADNLQPLHRRHHNAKTNGGWTVHRDSDTGESSWTSPQGRHYRTRPPERWTKPDPPG